MPVPPEPVLRAAVRWLEHLPGSSVARTRTLFTSHSSFGGITPTQYAAAHTWLLQAGLIDKAGRVLCDGARQLTVFRAAVSETLWLPDADVLISGPRELPEDASRAATALGLTPDDAFAAIRHAWGKVDTALRERVGVAGERALVELLSSAEDVLVEHVAAYSDGYGYDIAVETAAAAVHLEVKATTRRGRLTIYVSRNEFEVMVRDPTWMLIAIRLDPDLQPAALATVDRDWVNAVVPSDRGPGARWESVRLEVPPEALVTGLPGVRSILRGAYPPMFDGVPAWPG